MAGLYCVQSGRVKVYKADDEGKQVILRIAEEGDVLEISSLFTETPHMATAEAVEDSNVCFLDKNRFLSIINANVSVALKLIAQLSQDLSRLAAQLLDVTYKPVHIRLAKCLLATGKGSGAGGKGFLPD